MTSIALIVATAFIFLGTMVWADIVSAVPFAKLSIANPAIADFSTLSDRTVYILGKLTGTTTLTLIE